MKEKYYSETYYLNILRIIATIAVVILHVVVISLSSRGSGNQSIGINTKITYNIVHMMMNFCVPIFLMISGAIFLSTEKTITINKIINKYCKRIFLALFIFGIPCSLIEIWVESKTISVFGIFKSIYSVISAHSWVYLWYLYAIIGLYLITPILKSVINNCNDALLKYMIILLLIFTCIIPYLDQVFNIKIGFYTPFEATTNLLYYILGYYLSVKYKALDKNKVVKFNLLLIIVVIAVDILLGILLKGNIGPIFSFGSPITLAYSCAIFMIFKNLNLKPNKFIDLLSPLCFGMYLTHMYFIYILKYKGLSPLSMQPIIGIPVYSLIVFFVSATASFILRKIKFFRKYVL